ncbi:Sugar or nucleoside kinase, ribokinase family [Paracoccus isoporae]|uniref:Sugar or nucleoside kinase, ribokinase family n=1 Tax=Paracoccus isoporae TaxID=591205 RepID=A0A1G6XIX3_9RHOB|nr:PfkB family carbohydrate kinase [Paracoccus isoporae]SDD78120.1 Sugar or nucleoside kinase, ribokinase family [Paracoccus isoporae]
MSDSEPNRLDLLCIGAMLWDVIGRSSRVMAQGNDMPGRISHVPGGVALNVALALARWGMVPGILSAVGRDTEGEALIGAVAQCGVVTDFLCRDGGPTDVYMAIEDANGLIAAIADAHSLEDAGEMVLAPIRDGRLASADRPWKGVAVIDGNLTTTQLSRIAQEPGLQSADLRIVPASPGKAERLAPLIGAAHGCFYLNRFEAEVLAGRDLPESASAARAMLDLGMRRVIVTDGGYPVADGLSGEEILSAAPPAVTIARVTGAGDSFLAAHIAAERSGADRATALEKAAQAAAAHVSGKDMP